MLFKVCEGRGLSNVTRGHFSVGNFGVQLFSLHSLGVSNILFEDHDYGDESCIRVGK